MSDFKFRPLEGLLSLSVNDLKSISVFDMLQYVEGELSPSPKGRAKKLLLFFIVINELMKKSIPFYVKGGTILQYSLAEHARATNDLDVVVPGDSDSFFEKAKIALEAYRGEIRFEVKDYLKKPFYDKYFYSTFSFQIDVFHEGEMIENFILEGIYGDVFEKIDPLLYKGPSIIEDDFAFLGVPIEYIFAEKILAITSELTRPIKHLVDAYSLSKTDIDIVLLKRYLSVILEEEKKARKKFGYSCDGYRYAIQPNKQFLGNYVFLILQSGYNEDKDDVVAYLNNWMKENAL